MSFLIDKEELKPGLILFRRSDVAHRNWYCRIKIPKVDRYKTVSLKTSDINAARIQAWEQETGVRICLERNMPVFDRPFSEVAEDYAKAQEARAANGRITPERVKRLRSVIKAQLNPYVGSIQISRIGPESWEDYPEKRRQRGAGRLRATVSDATIRFEMSIFRAVMSYAAKKKLIGATDVPGGKLDLEKVRRDEFTPAEYRTLHTYARNTWLPKAPDEMRRWYRDMVYNFVLIMCNTGMRPSEARNLRWRDVETRKDGKGRSFVVLQVRGKKKQRQLVAAGNVAEFLERVRELSVWTAPDDPVFSVINTKPTGKRADAIRKGELAPPPEDRSQLGFEWKSARSLYKDSVRDLLDKAGLLTGPNGTPRSTYSFRHTYATFRLNEGVDVYFLAHQMGTSVKMIEEHYGHVNAVKNAEQILRGLPGWEPAAMATEAAQAAREAVAAEAPAARGKRPRKKKAKPADEPGRPVTPRYQRRTAPAPAG